MSKKTVWITTEIDRDVHLSDHLRPLGYDVAWEDTEYNETDTDIKYTVEGEDIEDIEDIINRIPGVVSLWIE